MKKFLMALMLCSTMVGGAAFAQEISDSELAARALAAGANYQDDYASYADDVGGGSLNTNSNNGAVTQVDSNNGNVTVTGGSYVESAPATQTVHQKIESNQAAPVALSNLVTSGQDTCFGSSTGGVSVAGFGVSGGSTVIDENCQTIKNAKLLASLGLKDAAITLLADSNEAIFDAISKANPELIKHLYDEQRIQQAFK